MFISNPIQPHEMPLPDGGDDSSGVLSILAVNGLFIPLVTIVMGFRLYTRFLISRHLFLDDYLMIAAAICFLVFVSVDIAGVAIGFGRHIWDLPGATMEERVESAQRVLQHNFVSLVFISPAICFSKLSIIATLLRIFTWQASRLLRHVLIATSLVVTVCCGSQFIFTIFQCTSIPLSWRLIDPDEKGSCANLEKAVLAAGVVNVVTDFVICCSPIPVFMKLQLPLRQRLCVSALFLSGLITSLFALLRVLSSRGLENNVDATYVVVPYFNYSVAEAGLCIITGSIPALRPLLANVLPNFVETHNLDNLVVSAKENIRRATSRQSSRRRASDAGAAPDSPRQSTAAAAGEPAGWTDAEAAEETTAAPAAPAAAARSWSWSPPPLADLLRRAGRAVAGWRGPSAEERARGRGRGRRPLSVINELDEVAAAAGQQGGAHGGEGAEGWGRPRGAAALSALRGSVAELFRKQGEAAQGVSARVADAGRRLAGVELGRRAGVGAVKKSPGSIIVVREVEVTESKRVVV